MKLLRIMVVLVFNLIAMSMSAQFAHVNHPTTTKQEKTSESKFYSTYNRVTLGYQPEFLVGKMSSILDDSAEYSNEGMTFKGFVFQYIHGQKLIPNVPFYIDGGFAVSYNYFKYADTSDKDKISKVQFSVPVNLAFRIGDRDYSFAPYLGMNVKAILRAEYNSIDKYAWKWFQIGCQLGLGVNLKKFYMGFEWGIDITELYKNCHVQHLGLNIGVDLPHL